MGQGAAASPPRATRADAARNRDRLLAAAKEVFAAGGAEASLEAVARRAGVGIATLYRHFPTRELLYEAVYRREVDELTALAERLHRSAAPEAALRAWMRANIDFVAAKKGMAAALALAAHNKALSAYSFERLTAAAASLMQRLTADGRLRRDVTPEDLLRTFIGVSLAQEGPDWRDRAARLMDVFIDGLLQGK